MLWVALHFPRLPPEALGPIGAWACQFTPKVSLEPPQELLLEVQGSLRLFGGFRPLTEKLAAGLRGLGYPFQLAAASTARAALWLARGEGETELESLPIEVTGFDVEFLRGIGISSVGALLELPREGLALRCGPAVIEDLDRALGAVPELRNFFAPPPRFDARLQLPAEITHAESLLFGARRLLVQLAGLLAARCEGVRGFRLVLLHENRAHIVEIAFASATRDAERMARVLRERLAQMQLAEPVTAMRLEAGDFVPFQAASAGMFGDAARTAEDWAELLERLRARLGNAGVHGLAALPDHRPEHAWRRIEPGEWDPRSYAAPGPRPVWLLEPKRLKESEFTALAGPERIESGWWDGDDARRDYFIARLPNAGLAWIFREAGEWYLHGLFA
ncbi:MAG TPA: DNA polymerase Y family protein [Burkholderiales bacterium]|nr:DNA polymerase Y family protein [Burkholderiales bacterium]